MAQALGPVPGTGPGSVDQQARLPDAPARPARPARRAQRCTGLLAALVLGLLTWLGALTPAAALPAAATGADVGAADEPQVTLVLFHGEGCPHCAAERAWLEQLAAAHPGLRMEQYEVWNDEANRALLADYAARLGFEPVGVPVTVVGDQVWIGFSEGIAGEIDAAVTAALASAGTGATAVPSPDPSTGGDGPDGEPADAASDASVDLPVAGTVDLADMSLLASTVLIGFADGINPCSLWVLAVLMAVVLHSGSRGRVALVGGTFLLVTASMYGLYIVGMYSALDYAGGLGWIRAAVAGIALALGVLQLKDGLGIRGGPSLSMSAQRRPKVIRSMRAVARPDRGIAATLAGTAALAVGVSLLETPCTAGLPLLWTSMLAEQGVALGTAVALFGVYMLVFLLDEMALFGAAVVTMRARRLQADEGLALKLLSGSLLVTLGVVMLVAPELMADLPSSLLVFAAAAALGGTLWAVVRRRGPASAPGGQRHLP